MRLAVAVLAVLLPLVLPLSASAAEASVLTLTAPPAPAGGATTVLVDLTSGGAPVVGVTVTVERRVAGTWSPVAAPVTDVTGRAGADVALAATAADNVVRATWVGDASRAAASSEVVVGLLPQPGRVSLDAPASVVQGEPARLRVRRSAATTGLPLAGPVWVEQRRDGGWRRVAEVATGADGLAVLDVRLDGDTRYRAGAPGLGEVSAATSPARRVRLRPPGEPVRLPRGAPRPRIGLPPQPLATTVGADPVVTALPDRVWAQMTGRSWHAGCPVGRAGLRLLRITYWDYDGFRRRGELVAATSAVDRMAAALSAMHEARLPIRSMYRVDRFGWSARVRGADDHASMAAGNTSAFNCRDVVNRPGRRSPHSSGRSLDVNPWENPFRSATGLVPNAWWQSRADPRVAWRSRGHAVVRIMAAHGLRWSYGLGDTQHFDAR